MAERKLISKAVVNVGQKSNISTEEKVRNFRSNLILKRNSLVFKDWVRYCKDILKVLESRGTLENNQLKGELSEVILEQYLKELQKALLQKGIDSTIIKNLGLVHRSETNDVLYSSEIDLCLATPYRCYLFEVKSYSGKKTLTKECFLKGVSEIDIFAQSKMHLDFFEMLFDDCRIKYTLGRKGLKSPYKLMFFECSTEPVIDKREQKWKDSIPYVNTGNIFKWFAQEIDDSQKPQWDLKKLNARFRQLDENRDLIMQYHIKRLQQKKD